MAVVVLLAAAGYLVKKPILAYVLGKAVSFCSLQASTCVRALSGHFPAFETLVSNELLLAAVPLLRLGFILVLAYKLMRIRTWMFLARVIKSCTKLRCLSFTLAFVVVSISKPFETAITVTCVCFCFDLDYPLMCRYLGVE